MKPTNNTRIDLLTIAALVIIVFTIQGCSGQQKKDPWTEKQLMEPATLAKILNDPNASQPLILCVGPKSVIKKSIDTGPAGESLDQLKTELSKLPKDASIVIYCGCCPFSRCPNVRPAFSLLNEMGFKNQKLLDLSHNIKVDWIDKGYPVNY